MKLFIVRPNELLRLENIIVIIAIIAVITSITVTILNVNTDTRELVAAVPSPVQLSSSRDWRSLFAPWVSLYFLHLSASFSWLLVVVRSVMVTRIAKNV